MAKNNFEQFSFNPFMMDVIKKLHFTEPTDIQKQVIPEVLAGKSVIGQSHTGSGKTHAFLLPLLSQINTENREVQLVITAPTRELALQLYDEVKKIIQYADKEGEWIPKLITGGIEKQKMADQLRMPPHRSEERRVGTERRSSRPWRAL